MSRVMEHTSGLVFRNEALRNAMQNANASESNITTAYILALEADGTPDPQWSFWDKIINTAVQTFQPKLVSGPVLTHVELFLPTTKRGEDMHFATYLGRHAGWGSEFGSDTAFYTGYNESKWRAIPVMGDNALARLREECSAEANAETAYSLTGYLFSVLPLRALASMRPNSVGSPAHCAALTARVLTRALPALNLSCSDAWYGPSTLFIEVANQSRMKAYQEFIADTTPDTLSLPEETYIRYARETLLSGTDDAVRRLTISACNMAVEAQARLVIKERATASDPGRMRVLEKGLARMLIRWSSVHNKCD